MRVSGWVVKSPAEPMVLAEREEKPGPGEVVIEVAGCGVCHTDLGFLLRRRAHPAPLPADARPRGQRHGRRGRRGRRRLDGPAGRGPGGHPLRRVRRLPGRARAGLPQADLPRQRRARRLRLPPARPRARPVPGARPRRSRRSTPRAGARTSCRSSPTPSRRRTRRSCAAACGEGDLAVFIGVGGVGGFGVQIAAALGATVVAIDVDQARLDDDGRARRRR